MKVVLTAIIVSLSLGAIGQSCIGKWIAIDDESFKEKSVVKLYRKGGAWLLRDFLQNSNLGSYELKS